MCILGSISNSGFLYDFFPEVFGIIYPPLYFLLNRDPHPHPNLNLSVPSLPFISFCYYVLSPFPLGPLSIVPYDFPDLYGYSK